jgi:hypothetical protein
VNPVPKLLAEELFDNQIESMTLEGKLHDFLETVLPSYEDWHIDYYDKSIEVYGPKVIEEFTKSDKIKSLFGGIGFHMIYLHQPNCKYKRDEKKPCCTSLSFVCNK